MIIRSIIFGLIFLSLLFGALAEEKYLSPGSIYVTTTESSCALTPKTITDDAMTVTSTVISYETESVRVTKTIEVTVTSTDFIRRTTTVQMTSTALSITVSTSTTRVTALITTKTTLTRFVFENKLITVPFTRTTVGGTITSETSVTIVSLSRSTFTVFTRSQYASTGTLTAEFFITFTNTLNIIYPLITSSDFLDGTRTLYIATALYIIDETVTNYATTIILSQTPSINIYPAGSVTVAGIVITPVISSTYTQFNILTANELVTGTTVGVAFPYTYSYTTISTLIF